MLTTTILSRRDLLALMLLGPVVAGRPARGWRAPDGLRVLVPPRCQALARARFDGHKGRPLVFDPTTRVLRQPLYVVSGDDVVGELV